MSGVTGLDGAVGTTPFTQQGKVAVNLQSNNPAVKTDSIQISQAGKILSEEQNTAVKLAAELVLHEIANSSNYKNNGFDEISYKDVKEFAKVYAELVSGESGQSVETNQVFSKINKWEHLENKGSGVYKIKPSINKYQE